MVLGEFVLLASIPRRRAIFSRKVSCTLALGRQEILRCILGWASVLVPGIYEC